jgi:ribosomal silencing factor RsfS
VNECVVKVAQQMVAEDYLVLQLDGVYLVVEHLVVCKNPNGKDQTKEW